MSLNTIERIFWEIGNEPERADQFLDDPDGYLARYPLTKEEFKMVRTMDVAALGDYGVSSMLGILVWTTVYGNNPLSMFDYLQRMNHGKLPNNMRLPGFVFRMMMFAVAVRKVLIGTLSSLGLKKSLN